MIYTVTLNPALDYVMHADSINGGINRSDYEELFFGGKGINVSCVLTRLGIANKALGFAAGFTGKQLEKMVRDDGIDCDFVYLDNGCTRINVKIRSGSETDFNASGAPIKDGDLDALMGKLDGLKEGDYLVLAGSAPVGSTEKIYEKILSRFDSRGVKYVIDASGDLLRGTLKFKPFLIKPNHHELGELFGTEIKCDDDAVKYAKELQKLGAENVLVSQAENGAVLVDENENVYKSANAKGTLVNSVGCGDSMVAGFLAGYIQSESCKLALRLATACANATAFSPSLATAEEINKLLIQE
ncbi:MAG: 1-phosphofructokinase [Eubacterium sp.]|nr:1-phosphofructokinase [Eubacterium sp.]